MMSVQLTRSNEAWVRDLSGPGEAQTAALTDLRALLLRAALFTLGRVHGELADTGQAQIEALAEECAQEALLAILERLPQFRFESKFTTWTYKFAVNYALTAARRERWKNVSLETLLDESVVPPTLASFDRGVVPPEQAAQQDELWSILHETIDHELTPRQRQVLNALVFEEVPLDEIARHLKSNRNAVYKLVHDARRKLKAGLEARGYRLGEILDLFSEPA